MFFLLCCETLLLEHSSDHVIPIADSVFNLPTPQFPHLSVLWMFGLWWLKYTLIWNRLNLVPDIWSAFPVGLSFFKHLCWLCIVYKIEPVLLSLTCKLSSNYPLKMLYFFLLLLIYFFSSFESWPFIIYTSWNPNPV